MFTPYSAKSTVLVALLSCPVSGPFLLRLVPMLTSTSIGVALFRYLRKCVVNPNERVGIMWLLRLVAAMSAVGQRMLGPSARSGEQVPRQLNTLPELLDALQLGV